VYILHSAEHDRYYVGYSDDPLRRLEFHNTVEKGFTSRYRPWALVYTREYATKTEALKAEAHIKRWKSKIVIKRLVSGELQL
jgi:putative endonuclease